MTKIGDDKKIDNEVDIWRDTPVRLLGYANEVGEAFRSLVKPGVVRASYGVAFTYVFADTYDKSSKAIKKGENVGITAADTLIWQTFASVLIPGLTINRICALSLLLLKYNKRMSIGMMKWTTTGIGLGCIPLIVHPIDKLVDYLMDNTFRVFIGLKGNKSAN